MDAPSPIRELLNPWRFLSSPSRKSCASVLFMWQPVPSDLADDPVWQAILRAPSEDETPEEAAIVAKAKVRGGAVPGPEVSADLE